MDYKEAFARVEKEEAYAHIDVVPVDEPWTMDPFGGISGSTDLGLVADALKPEKVDVACFGLVRASDIRAHAADEFVYVEDLITMTKELVHYFAF